MKTCWISCKPLEHNDLGALITIEDFVEAVLGGAFIDDDGYGYYATDSLYFPCLIVMPSDMKNNGVIERFSHVYWFNK